MGIILIFTLLLSGCQLMELPGTPGSAAALPGSGTASIAMAVPNGVGANLDQAPVVEPELPPEEEPAEEPIEEPAEEPQPAETEETPLFPSELRIVAGQAFVYDLDEGKMIAMKGEGEQLYPASTTKLLTILMAQRYLELDMQVTPGDEQTLVSKDSSMAYIDRYDTVTVEQLIEGMLLPSGNDAAYALAAATGRAITGEWNLSGLEAVEICIEAMNEYAAELGMTGAIAAANTLAEENPGSFIPGQFENPANAQAHFDTTGPEIWQDTQGSVDIFVAGVGTGGTITGTGRYLKAQKPTVEILAVEPAASPLLSQGKAGPHGLQGIGANFVPKVLDTGIYDKVIPVTEAQAYETAKLLGKCEGVLAGISSGAALYAAIEAAKLAENAGKTIVVLLPDTGERYLSTGLYD